MNIPTRAQLQKAHEQARKIWQRHLRQHGVSEPPGLAVAKGIWIATLMHAFDYHREEWLHKDFIAEVTTSLLPDLGRDQQVRHLKRDGWNVESLGNRGKHRITDPYQPHPSYINEQRRRASQITAQDFEELKEKTGYQCLTCGAIEGEPSPRYGEGIVKLQQGHRDPEQAPTMDNIIPQCQYCNRGYRDYFTFDEKGRVRAVASIEPVAQASLRVQQKIYQFLQAQKLFE